MTGVQTCALPICKTVGLWGDAEKTFLLSEPYLKQLWKTIDDVEAQEKKAKALVKNMGQTSVEEE
mgnify:CR=1 FL=1